ncbi:MAG TPA: hypothetical protein VFZ83_12415 [Acidimicrobiia bacterium]|nr:hypothetical protein [Acidimicrobiia bacterium]
MFHVVTVHWQSDAWIEPQLRFLSAHFPPDTRVYASLEGIDERHDARFHHVSRSDATHAQKLNALAAVVAEQADPGDHLVFLDGDAFPIAPITPALLGGAPLAAVRRDENLGDRQPHPCFCVTTVGFWTEIGGDWSGGHRWENSLGESVTDVGGNLLGILAERGVEWRPLLRSNRTDLHPLWFAVYGDVVYHHGAGFREMRLARLDGLTANINPYYALARSRIPPRVPVLAKAERTWRRRRAASRRARWVASEGAAQSALAREIYEQLLTDDEFFRRFTD